MTDSRARIAFVGGGNMTRSIIGGLIASGHPADRIAVGEPGEEARARLAELGDLALSDDNATVIDGADLVVMAVKPQVMKQVLSPLAGQLAEQRPVLMSIAAGITVDMLRRWAGELPLVRCMPNTPSLVGAGASGLYANDAVDETGRALATTVMEAVGLAVWVEDEALIDAVIAASGSGPAYFFRVMELMVAGGTDLGLPESTARALVLQTALGAARMALESGTPPDELRRQVTSPGGTTEAALATFEDRDLGGTIAAGMRAAVDRAGALARELDD
jgi:pyrroline-5-carboxylate reductase